ncbi:MAG: hypothetical protein ACREVI_01300 [Steroidobacteraceae bacterium]
MRPLGILALLIITGAAAADQKAESPAAISTAKGTAAASAPEPAAAGRETRFGTMDRLELGTTSITGNQELPKVMYVVPWKKAELGDLSGKPARSLIDEILAPVDRDVFRREVGYFETLAGESAVPAAQVENPVTPETAQP